MAQPDEKPTPWYRIVAISAGVVGFVAIGLLVGSLARPGSEAVYEAPESNGTATGFSPVRRRPRLNIKPKPGQGPLNLKGQVVDQAGRPVARCAITADFELGPGTDSVDVRKRPEIVAVADDEGKFELVGVEAGRYRLKVEGFDIFTAEVRFIEVPRDFIKLIVARIVSVAGVVVVGNTPMADVEVSLRGETGGVRKVVSGRDGRFEFTHLAEGVYEVWVASGDQAAAVQRVSRMGTGPFADVVLQVEPAAIVNGTVQDRSGNGVVAAVVLRAVDLEEPPRYATSSGDGSFSIEGVPKGRWTAEALAPGFVSTESVTFSVGDGYTPALVVARGGIVEGRVVDINGGSIDGAVITVRAPEKPVVSAAARAEQLRRFRGLRAEAPGTKEPRFIPRGELGVVVGPIPYPPPPGAVATTATAPEPEPGSTPPGAAEDKPLDVPAEHQSTFVSDNVGAFRVTGLAPGRYRAVATHKDYADGMSKPFTLVVGKRVRGVKITLKAGVIVAGKVTDKRGQAVVGAVITAETADKALRDKQAVTGSDGTYELAPIGHDVTLRVTALDHGDASRKLRIRSTTMAVVRRSEDFVLANLDAELRGRVVDPAGFPVRGARVVIGGATTAKGREAKTDDNGLFAIAKVAAGRYPVTVEHPGYPTQKRTLVADKDSDIKLPFGGGIEGTIRDGHTAAGLPGAQVLGRGPNGARFDTSAQQDGALSMVPLAAGTWRLTVKVPGYVTARKRVAVGRGDKPGAVTVRDLLIELRRGAIIGGTVRDADGERVRAATVWVAGRPQHKATTDEHGRFRLDQVPTGDIVVKAKRGAADGSLKVSLSTGDHLGTLEIELGKDQ